MDRLERIEQIMAEHGFPEDGPMHLTAYSMAGELAAAEEQIRQMADNLCRQMAALVVTLDGGRGVDAVWTVQIQINEVIGRASGLKTGLRSLSWINRQA